MTEKEQTKATMANQQSNSGKVGYDTAFLSMSIVVINIILAFLKLNNTDLSVFHIYEYSFLLPVITLALTSIDILFLYFGKNTNTTIKKSKRCAKISLCCSIFILVCNLLVLGNTFKIDESGMILLIGNIVGFFGKESIPFLNQSVLLFVYFVSAVLQGISTGFKISYNYQIKHNTFGGGEK